MSYESVKLEKGMYGVSGKSFSQVLESLDPSENYKDTPLEGLDAFGRQLKRFGIKVSGKDSDTVEKFFKTTDAAALFPEYISRSVNQGINHSGILEGIIASKTNIDSLDYRSIRTMFNDSATILPVVAEGATMPTINITPAQHLVKLKKHGINLETTYEAIRFQKLDVLGVTLKQVGRNIAKTQLSDAIQVLISGDGNANDIPEEDMLANGGVTLGKLLKSMASFPYEANTIIVSPQGLGTLMGNADVQKAAGFGFDSGASSLPSKLFGADLYRTGLLTFDAAIVLDKTCAIEMVTAGDVSLETDRLIDRQLNRTAISTTYGFSKLFDNACKLWAF